MQLYRVKLNEGHKLDPKNVVEGYVADSTGTEAAIYEIHAATKFAEWFNGTVEPFGKNYPMGELKIIQLNKADISSHVIHELDGREAFRDADPDLNECMYYSDVFSAILGEHTEQTLLSFNRDVIDELMVLDMICAEYQYVMLTKF